MELVIIKHHITLELANEAATIAAAQQFSSVLQAGMVIYLHGDLGAGKTTFVRGVLNALGYIGKVKSPTYTLVESYAGLSYLVHHFDLYRFNDDEEWEAAGFRDYFNTDSVCFVEWPEKAETVLPMPDIDVDFQIHTESRTLLLTAHSDIALKAFPLMNTHGLPDVPIFS